MQVKLNSPRSRKMSDKTNKNGVLGKLKATSAVQIISKEKKFDHKCYAAANCNNRSENRPDLLFRAFPSGTQQLKKWEIDRMKRGDGLCHGRKQVLFF